MAGSNAGLRRFVIGALGAPYRKFKAWRQRRRTLHQLRRLDEQQLRDIGLSSQDVERFR